MHIYTKMKRKRDTEDKDQSDPHPRNQFYDKEELLLSCTQLQLDYNRQFNMDYNYVDILKYAQAQTELDIIGKIAIILSACIKENIFKTLDEIKQIIETTRV